MVKKGLDYTEIEIGQQSDLVAESQFDLFLTMVMMNGMRMEL